MARAGTRASKRTGTSDGQGEAESAYDPHVCEYCGTVLPDPGLAFLEHLEESPTCQWLWTNYLPYVREDAGAD